MIINEDELIFPTSRGYWVTSSGVCLYPEDPYERQLYYFDLNNFDIKYTGGSLDMRREIENALSIDESCSTGCPIDPSNGCYDPL